METVKNKIISDNDINITISTLSETLIDILKDIEYLEEKKNNESLNDAEYQELADARVFGDAIKTTINFYKNIL
ncbi:hypothetical protein EBU71_04125 [bacterium]|nr:hypothetical protein [Candidatus Elulimicrobium humile]